jgi:hypothetical protein
MFPELLYWYLVNGYWKANFRQFRKFRKFQRTFLRVAMPSENLSIDLTVTSSKSPEFWYGSPAQDKQVLN